jgi:hypothetical protein
MWLEWTISGVTTTPTRDLISMGPSMKKKIFWIMILQGDNPVLWTFFRTKGYEVVFSDPESNRYDEESGEVIGHIQCRRDVMRKGFAGHAETEG